MKIWGRITNEDGSKTWVETTTDATGDNSMVYLINFIQVLKLNLGESPFFANYGIPAQSSVIQQMFPDLYVNAALAQFSQYFATLRASRVSENPATYDVNATTLTGVTLTSPIPQ